MNSTVTLIKKFDKEVNVKRLTSFLARFNEGDILTFHRKWKVSVPVSDVNRIVDMVKVEYGLENEEDIGLDHFDIYFTVSGKEGKFKFTKAVKTRDKTIPVLDMII